MDGGAETCILRGLDENTFPYSERSDSEFPFSSMHLPWLSIKFCLFTAFPLCFLLILSFLSSSWFMPIVWPVVSFLGPCIHSVHCKNMCEKYLSRGLCLLFMYRVSTMSHWDINCFWRSHIDLYLHKPIFGCNSMSLVVNGQIV